MDIYDWLRGSSDDSDDDERPPKPDVEQDRKEIDRTRYEATVEYRNGDVETFECYGIYSRGESVVTFNMEPGPRVSVNADVRYSYSRRSINYETLAREPELTELGTDTFVITFTRDWEWRREGMAPHIAGKSWCEEPTDLKLTIESGDE